MDTVFWVSLGGIFYAYIGYPLLLFLIAGRSSDLRGPETVKVEKSISLIIPVHNEEKVIQKKIENTLALSGSDEFEIIIVSDGSNDTTSQIVASYIQDSNISIIDLPERQGKANALNVGVAAASGEIIVFSDASIMLKPNAVKELISAFDNPEIGCVSGEDKVEGLQGEGLYGRYELFLRRKESDFYSIVGASGSFYAQRKYLVANFPAGVAPDFLSVLNTVKRGYRAITVPKAVGVMKAAAKPKKEFQRKVRTAVRGMTALFGNVSLLNPLQYPRFSFMLVSHKLLRWMVPLLMLIVLVTNIWVANQSAFYNVTLAVQAGTYAIALVSGLMPYLAERCSLCRIIHFFVASNLALLIAWSKYLSGVRQEIWTPTDRDRDD